MPATRPDRSGWVRRGFTLAELMLVLAILALAGLIVLPTIGRMALGEERRVREGVIEIVLDRAYALPSGWWVRTRAEDEAGPRRGGIRTVEEITGREPPPRVMMTWSPGGLVSQCD